MASISSNHSKNGNGNSNVNGNVNGNGKQGKSTQSLKIPEKIRNDPEKQTKWIYRVTDRILRKKGRSVGDMANSRLIEVRQGLPILVREGSSRDDVAQQLSMIAV